MAISILHNEYNKMVKNILIYTVLSLTKMFVMQNYIIMNHNQLLLALSLKVKVTMHQTESMKQDNYQARLKQCAFSFCLSIKV